MGSALNFAEAIEVMQELGISILTPDGEYRCLADILDDLAHQWNHSEYELLPPEEDESDELTKFLSGFKITERR